ncbi:agamous-like MADS-box protein AGL80 [Capsella rubella]|uniref:agamous-like MADS-box protein AGL80 n=1 Tax=Capsella rubella TaxID=81985 RepID=UPI000CD5BE32|nr:agamous-like MADS-box protein AGL80 [Capsella rubella]
MPRKNVKLAWVENDKARAKSLKQRREALLKKVKELTILCDIQACLIIFSPNEVGPVVWPSVEKARGLLDDFFALPELAQKNKETSIESFLKEKTKTVHKKLMESDKKNKDSLLFVIHQCFHLRETKNHYLIDQWVLDPKPLEPLGYQRSYCPYKGSSSNGNPNLEMELFCPEVMSFFGLGESTAQPLQHHNMNDNPIMDMNQREQYSFDFMSHEMEIQEEGNNNATMTNDDVRQEPPRNETTNMAMFDINRDWLNLNNNHF